MIDRVWGETERLLDVWSHMAEVGGVGEVTGDCRWIAGWREVGVEVG